MRFKRGYHLMLLAVFIFILDFFTLGNRVFINNMGIQQAAFLVLLACIIIFIIGLIKTIREFAGRAHREEMADKRAGKATNSNNKKTEPRAISDTVIRFFIAALLFLSAIPLLLNLITLPMIVLAVVVSIYLIASKSHHLSFEIFIFILTIALVALFGGSLFNGIKGLLLYAPPSSNSLIGLFIFLPAFIVLLVSTSYLLLQNILLRLNFPFFRNHPSLTNFSILLAIIFVIFALLFARNIELKPGNYLIYDGSMTKQEALLEISSDSEFTYTLKETNPGDRPMNILRIFGNKEEIDLNSPALERAVINDSKIVIPPNSTAEIIILTSRPFYIITVDVENQFPPQGFNFWK